MIVPDSASMDVDTTHEPDPTIFKKNTSAVRNVAPRAADLLTSVLPPDSLAIATGRDGEVTFAWTEAEGGPQWLGHTTMPSVSCAAIANAFQPGSGNALLFGFGQGGEVRRLLDRLAVHQAVFIVDPCAWGVAAAMRLRDYSADVLCRRLILFVGDDAWDDCRTFLLEQPGYLVPQRVLSWPWFEQDSIAMVSRRLADIQTAVASHRATLRSRPLPAAATRRAPAIAVVSNIPSGDIRRLAARISEATAEMGGSCERFVLDDPAKVHPSAAESALDALQPDVTILIDVVPSALQHALPQSPVFLLCSHSQPLSETWLGTVPPTVRLGVRNERQRAQARAAGIPDARLTLIAPAAAACPASCRKSRTASRRRILLLGDAGDIAPESIGLHLRSHCRLWATATDLIGQRVDSYRDEDAAGILSAAEQTLDIHLDSDEVRRGLTDRIRASLGPSVVRRAYAVALSQADVPFDVGGSGWDAVPELAAHRRRPAPDPRKPVGNLAEYDVLVSLETSGLPPSDLLDGLAAGAAGWVRRHPIDATPDGLAAILDLDRHVSGFAARSELVDLASRCAEDYGMFAERAAAAAEHLNAAHTWGHRLRTLLDDLRCPSATQ